MDNEYTLDYRSQTPLTKQSDAVIPGYDVMHNRSMEDVNVLRSISMQWR